jgi:hypothetical protein
MNWLALIPLALKYGLTVVVLAIKYGPVLREMARDAAPLIQELMQGIEHLPPDEQARVIVDRIGFRDMTIEEFDAAADNLNKHRG